MLLNIPPQAVILGGLTAFTLLVVQVLLGLRFIRLGGGRHWKVHKWLGLALVAIAAAHGLAAFALFGFSQF